MATETVIYALALALMTRLYVAYNPPTFLQQHIDLCTDSSTFSSSSFPSRKYHLRRQTIDATTSTPHITYSSALHPFTLADVEDNDSKANSHATRSMLLSLLVHPLPKLTCICLDISEIDYRGSLAVFFHDHELNTAIRHIQTALPTSSCRNNNNNRSHNNHNTSSTTSFCCADCFRHASVLWALLDQHKLLKPVLTVIWEDGRWCCLEGRVLYALTQLRWRGPVQVQVLLDQNKNNRREEIS